MEHTHEYEALIALVAHGSLRAASERSGLPRSTLSRAVRRLEARLGVPLFVAEDGTLHPTAEARQLAADAARILRDIARSERAVRGGPRPLVLTTPSASGDPRLAGMITGFLAAHPEIPLELRATGRHLDLAAEDVDLAVRAGGVAAPDQVVVPLLTAIWALRAHPRYLDARGWPRTLDDLAGHDLLLPVVGGDPRYWPLPCPIPRRAVERLRTNDLGVLRAAACAGLGVGLLNVVLGHDDDGLTRVLPELQSPPTTLSLVYPEDRRADPRVRAFVAYAREFWAARLKG